MTYAQLLTNLKGRVGLSNISTYDSLLKMWLNDGQRNITTRFLWNFLQQQETVTTVAADDSYDLSADCLVYDVRDSSNSLRLSFMRDIDFDTMYSTQSESGAPRFYRMFGQTKSSESTEAVPKIQFYPIPDDAYLIIVKSYGRLDDMVNGTDISAIPAVYHELMIHYAANIYFSSRGDARSVEQFDLYENKLADMVSQLGGIPTDNIDVVRSMDSNISTPFLRFPSNFENS